MKSIKTFIICIVLFLAERVLFGHITIFSMTPWLLLAFWFDMAIMSEESGYIPLYAGLCGLLLDVTGGGHIGVNTAVFAVVCLLVNYVASGFLRSGFFVGMAVVFSAFLLAETCCLLLGNISVGSAFFTLILPQSVLNTLFAALMYPAVKRLYFLRRIVL